MTDYLFAGLSVELQPKITKWSFEDLGDDPAKHLWRAWWAGGMGEDVCGIELRAYPVIKVNPVSVWINTDGRREATKQPWEDGAPGLEWIPFDPAWMIKRICYKYSRASWAKSTQDEAIRSLAIRLTRWSSRIASDVRRANSAAYALEKLRPDMADFAETARKNLK